MYLGSVWLAVNHLMLFWDDFFQRDEEPMSNWRRGLGQNTLFPTSLEVENGTFGDETHLPGTHSPLP